MVPCGVLTFESTKYSEFSSNFFRHFYSTESLDFRWVSRQVFRQLAQGFSDRSKHYFLIFQGCKDGPMWSFAFIQSYHRGIPNWNEPCVLTFDYLTIMHTIVWLSRSTLRLHRWPNKAFSTFSPHNSAEGHILLATKGQVPIVLNCLVIANQVDGISNK